MFSVDIWTKWFPTHDIRDKTGSIYPKIWGSSCVTAAKNTKYNLDQNA